MAARLAPAVLDYCVFAHHSDGAATPPCCRPLGAQQPLPHLGLRLGRARVQHWPLAVVGQSACRCWEMASFASAGVAGRWGHGSPRGFSGVLRCWAGAGDAPPVRQFQVFELCPAYRQANGQRTECDSTHSQGTHPPWRPGLTADSVGWQQRGCAVRKSGEWAQRRQSRCLRACSRLKMQVLIRGLRVTGQCPGGEPAVHPTRRSSRDSTSRCLAGQLELGSSKFSDALRPDRAWFRTAGFGHSNTSMLMRTPTL